MLTLYTGIISIFGMKAFFLHFFQFILYIINAYLVYLLLRQFFHNVLALLLAVIFLVHPINSEVAVYIADTQDVLFFFFGMLALIIAMYKNNNTGTLLSCIFLGLSLLSKETGILFFIPVFLIRFFSVQKNRRTQFTFFTISMTTIIVAYGLLRIALPLTSSSHFNIHMVASADQILKTLPSIMFFYIKTLVFPKDLAFMHLWIINDVSFSNFYFPLIVDVIFIAAILFLGFACRRRRNIFIVYIFFTIWFTIGMLFHLNLFIGLDMIAAERWFYFPFVGLLGLIGIALGLLPKLKMRYLAVLFTLWLVIIVLLSVRTSARVPNWKDSHTLYTHDLKVEENFVLENVYGNWLLRNGKKEDAKYHLDKSKRELKEWVKSSKKFLN